MDSIIQVFRMHEVSVDTRIRIIKELGNVIDYQYGSNVTARLVIELILAIDPTRETELWESVQYGMYMAERESK